MNKTKVVACTCDHKAQDAIYGKHQRATTPVNGQQEKRRFVVRCTVCGKEHDLGSM